MSTFSWTWFWASYLLAVSFGVCVGVVLAGLLRAAKDDEEVGS